MDLYPVIRCDDYPILSRPSVCASSTFGTDDLGRAMTVCQDHFRLSATVMIPPPRIPDFAQGWEACTKVWAAWLDSEEARKQREREAEIERQRQFVNEVAGKLR